MERCRTFVCFRPASPKLLANVQADNFPAWELIVMIIATPAPGSSAG